jgi:hypothetical protein
MLRSQQLALKYFAAVVILFGVMTIAGLMSGLLLYKSGFSLWLAAVQYRQDTAYRHDGDMAADGFHGGDLLVSARRTGP